MKSIFDMNGTERAAALMVVLGPETASEILKHLDEESIEKLSLEMLKIQSLSDEDREDLVGEFILELKRTSSNSYGGKNRARKMIVDAFGPERAESLINKIENRDPESGFKFLLNIKDSEVFELLKDEQPQILALVLSFIPPAKSAVVMQTLPPATSKDVAIRLVKMKNPSPEAAVAVARALKKRYKEFKAREGSNTEEGGVNSLVNILAHMSNDQEKSILRGMDVSVPHISREIMDRIFLFENVVNLSNSEIRIVIDEVGDDSLVARALKGAGDEIRFKFLRNMSQNRATDIINDMEIMGPIKLSDVEDCRSYIVQIVRDLSENGVIVMKRNGEIFVD